MPFLIPEIRTTVTGNTTNCNCSCFNTGEQQEERARCVYDPGQDTPGEEIPPAFIPTKTSYFKTEAYREKNAIAWKECRRVVAQFNPDPSFFSALVHEVTNFTEEQITAKGKSLRAHHYTEIVEKARQAAESALSSEVSQGPSKSRIRKREFNLSIKKPDGEEKTVSYSSAVHSPVRSSDDVRLASSRFALETLQEMMKDDGVKKEKEEEVIVEEEREQPTTAIIRKRNSDSVDIMTVD